MKSKNIKIQSNGYNKILGQEKQNKQQKIKNLKSMKSFMYIYDEI